MRIVSLASGDTLVSNKELETAVHKLAFTFNGVMAALAETAKPNIQSHLDTIINNTSLTLTKQDGFTTDTLIQDIKLKDLGEISTFHEGVIKITRAFDAGVGANNTCAIEFTVEIDEESALAMDDKAKLMLSVANKPTGVTLAIDVIDSPINGNIYSKYESKFVNANVAKDFRIEEHYAVALPIASLTSLELHYSNGKVMKLTADEIKKIKFDDQDETIIINGLVTAGVFNWAVLDVRACTKLNVILSSSTNFYLLKKAIA